MKTKRLNAFLALTLVICLLLSACTVPGITLPPSSTECEHANKTTVNAKASTCSEKGYSGDVFCPDCNTVLNPGHETDFAEHSYDEGMVTKRPTCISTGLTTYTCTVCRTVKTSVIATIEHNDSYHDAEDGTHFHTCTTCTLNENSAHNPTDSGVKFAASCTEPAYTQYTCADCNGVYKVYSETELAIGHQLATWALVSSATCSAAGEKTQSCTRSGCDYKNTITIPTSPDAHIVSFTEYITAPNCTNGGVAKFNCANCSYGYTDNVPANGIHNYVTQTAADGVATKKCSACDDVISSHDASDKITADLSASEINKEQSLEMSMQEATIQFPKDVVSQVVGNSTEVSISAGFAEDSAKAEALDKITDEEQKALIESAPVYDFTVTVDGTAFSANFSTKVAVTVSYDNGDNDADGIVIYYLAENGEIETITDVVYDAENKTVSFFVDHFSYYAVAYKETQAMRCKRGNHDYEATSTTHEASCYAFGYTLYECSSCHVTTVDDIVARLDHNYGELIPASPTCDRGDYITRVCSNDGCGNVLRVQFVRATGHAMDAPATCTTPATCTKCNKVLAKALGHDWTEWHTVKVPTENDGGSKRRYCLNCGEMQEAELSSTGTLDSTKFNSYSELINVVLGDVIGVSSGTISLEVEEENYITTIDVTVEKTEKGYRMSAVVDGKIHFYYDNGAFVGYNGTNGGAGSVDALLTIGFDAAKAVMNQLYTQLDSFAVEYLQMFRDYVTEFKDVCGDDINKILADAGLSYTVDDVDTLINSVENVYCYLALKLGYPTGLTEKDDVLLPTAEDFRNVLEAVMTAKENGGVTVYTLDSSPLVECATELSAFIEEHVEDTLGEFVYFLIGEKISEYNEDLTDFDAIIDFIATEFTGSLTVSDAIDKYIEFANKNNLPSVSTIYSLIDDFALVIYDEVFDCEKYVSDNGSKTLNDLAAAITGNEEASVAELYSQIKAAMSDTLVGDINLNNMTLAQFSENLALALECIEIKGDVSISVDSEGRIIEFNYDRELWATPELDSSMDLEEVISVKLDVVHDERTTVEIPENIKPALNNIKQYYDSEGNLVIEGLDKDTDFIFSAGGYGYSSLDEALVKDEALSTSYGYDVYALKEEYWSNTYHLGEFLCVDGKYYAPDGYTDPDGWTHFFATNAILINEYTTGETIDALISSLKIDDSDNNQCGNLFGTDTPVYPFALTEQTSTIGIAYKVDGEWMISTRYSNISTSLDSGYVVTDEYSFDDFKSTLKLVSTSDVNAQDYWGYSYYVDRNGEYIPAVYLNVAYGDGEQTVQLYGFEEGGRLYIISDYSYSDYVSVYDAFNPDNSITLPEYDSKHEYDRTIYVKNASGGLDKIEVVEVDLYKLVPSYYVKLSDGLYTYLNSSYICQSYDTTGADTLSLPDGNTLYVIGSSTDNDYAYKYGYETVYGYAKTASGMFIQAAALMLDGNVVEVLYRGVTSEVYIDLEYAVSTDGQVTSLGNGSYKISAAVMNKLKVLCTNNGASGYITVSGSKTVGDVDISFRYYVGTVSANIEIDDNEDKPNYSFWENLFGYTSHDNSYSVTHNSDGSITLTFVDGREITDVSYWGNAEILAETVLKKDTATSAQTGLDIYYYEASSKYNITDYYVYKNGKYYNYSTYSNYDFTFTDTLSVSKGWRLGSMYYRFDMVGQGELPDGLPVYETLIYIPYYGRSIEVYTFVMNGRIYAAVGAEVTGESLLTFEDYMPLDEYMESLKIETVSNGYSYTEYYNGVSTTLYKEIAYLYETDENGAKLDEQYDYLLDYVYYMLDGTSTKKYIKTRTYLSDVLTLGSEVPASETAGAINVSTSVNSYYNGSFTIAGLTYERTRTYTYRFVKLAGRYYRYGSDSGWIWGTYNDEKLNEYEFNNMTLDKVWYYVVVDEYDNRTYYTEFIPSDSGFTPSGSMINPEDIEGYIYNQTLLGYTPDGDALYEYVYYVTADSTVSDLTQETQADGTVFLHKNGVGYLKVTENGSNYYVRARRVNMSNGTTQIYCFLRRGVLIGDEVNESTNGLFNNLLSYSGNKLTISADFLAATAGNNKNDFYIDVYRDGYYYTYLDYYKIESLFMLK